MLVVLGVTGLVLTSWAPDRPVEDLVARWAPSPSKFLELDGMRVHYRDEGPPDDPLPIVLLHGTSASLHTWQGWTDALAPSRRVIRMDLPGFGLTGPAPDGDYSMPAFVRFMQHFLDRLGVRRCVLAGNSLGGAIAWNVAVVEPERVVKLVLVDSGGQVMTPRSMPIGFQLAQMSWLQPITSRVLPRSIVVASLRDVYGDPERVTPALVERYYELALREGNRASLAARFAAPQPDAMLIPRVKAPTLILWGGRDRLIPPENGEKFEQQIAGSRRVVFPELGHVPHEEDPARTVEEIKKFLAE